MNEFCEVFFVKDGMWLFRVWNDVIDCNFMVGGFDDGRFGLMFFGVGLLDSWSIFYVVFIISWIIGSSIKDDVSSVVV